MCAFGSSCGIRDSRTAENNGKSYNFISNRESAYIDMVTVLARRWQKKSLNFPKICFILKEGVNPSDEFLAKIKVKGVNFKTGSKFKDGKGVLIAVRDFKEINHDEATLSLLYYYGNMASETSAVRIKRVDGIWTIVAYLSKVIS